MGKKRDNTKLIVTILIIAMLCGTVLALAMINPGFFTFITNIYQQSGIQDGQQNDQNGQNGQNDGQNNQPYIGTWISLNIPVDECQREDIVTYSINSDYRNVAVDINCQYVGLTAWQKMITVTLNSQGSASISIVHSNAGEWNVQAKHASSSIVSNTENIVVNGITIYQQKDTWQVGESYTGQLTGTYKGWTVAILWKNSTSNIWLFYCFQITDPIGMIPYGVLQVFLFPGTTGSRDVIAIIDPKDSWGNMIYVKLEMYDGAIPNDALNDAVSQGHLVKSNILTFTITP